LWTPHNKTAVNPDLEADGTGEKVAGKVGEPEKAIGLS
jgi:hypothetical protein